MRWRGRRPSAVTAVGLHRRDGRSGGASLLVVWQIAALSLSRLYVQYYMRGEYGVELGPGGERGVISGSGFHLKRVAWKEGGAYLKLTVSWSGPK